MASTSSGGSHMADALTCAVCCGPFKTPKMLPCGHSFCLEPCLKTLLEVSSPSCPLCRHDINPPSTDAGAEDFPTNFALQSVIATSRKRPLEPPLDIDHSECHLHGEVVEVVCETCMEFLCGTCVRQPHDENHITKKISEVAAENVNTLEIIEEELNHSELLLEENDKSIEDANVRCKAEANQLEADIIEGAASVTTLLREKVDDLHLKVKGNNAIVEEKAREFSLQNTHLKHATDYAKYIKGTLLAVSAKSEIQRSAGVADLSTKSRKIRRDIGALRNQLRADERELSLSSDIMPDFWFDQAKRGVERIGKRGKTCAPLIRTFFHGPRGKMVGFVMYTFDEIYYLSHNSKKLSFTPMNSKLNVPREGIKTGVENVMTISPILGKTNATLFNSSDQVKSANEYSQVYTAKLEHLADPLFRIRAVSWDGSRQHCYAILNDNITIVHLKFGKTSDDQGGVKLSKPVYVKSNNEFHVSVSGGMAICDTAHKNVKYFASIQSQVTKSISSPPELVEGVPKCIISQDSDHKWFVFWDGTPGSDVVGIYQYSDCFEIEQFVLNVSNVMSFNFLGNRFLAIHTPDPAKGGHYRFQILVLHNV